MNETNDKFYDEIKFEKAVNNWFYQDTTNKDKIFNFSVSNI